MRRLPVTAIAIAMIALLGACESYDFTVNEKVVYSPRPLFSDYEVTDPALSACVEQAIADNRVTAAPELASLNCSHAGIESLDGLSVFTGLTRLKLSSNRIRNLMALQPLTLLRELYLDDNQVIDPVPLYELPALKVLDLSGNGSLQCPSSAGFARVEQLSLPEHCRS